MLSKVVVSPAPRGFGLSAMPHRSTERTETAQAIHTRHAKFQMSVRMRVQFVQPDHFQRGSLFMHPHLFDDSGFFGGQNDDAPAQRTENKLLQPFGLAASPASERVCEPGFVHFGGWGVGERRGFHQRGRKRYFAPRCRRPAPCPCQ